MKGGKKLLYAGMPVVFTLVMGIIAGTGIYPVFHSGAAEWKAAWIMNAPEYEYRQGSPGADAENAGKKNWTKSLTVGTQYGELYWKEETEKIPLYYGDHEKILQTGAGTYTGYGLPGQGKQILIGAHDTTYFSGLGELEKGDRITLDTIGGRFIYTVTKTEIVDVTQILEEGGKEELILYTCYPFGETDGTRPQRYLVYCQPA